MTGDDRPAVAVLDLDGVLADTRHRLHHLAGRKDWDAFFAAAPDDPVHPEGRAVVDDLLARGLGIVYLSGRPERTRADTLAWLRRHGLPDGELLLRPDGDRRPARLVKLAALRRLSRRVRPVLLVDDDPQVLDAVSRARPSPVAGSLLADWQPRDAATADAQERRGRT